MSSEYAFTIDTSSIKYGPGVTREIGFDMKQFGARRIVVMTDPRVAKLEPVSVVTVRATGMVEVILQSLSIVSSSSSTLMATIPHDIPGP